MWSVKHILPVRINDSFVSILSEGGLSQAGKENYVEVLLNFVLLFVWILRGPNTQSKFSFLQTSLSAWGPTKELKGKTMKHKGDQCHSGDEGSTVG